MKKIISISVAAVMTASTVCGLAACGSSTKDIFGKKIDSDQMALMESLSQDPLDKMTLSGSLEYLIAKSDWTEKMEGSISAVKDGMNFDFFFTGNILEGEDGDLDGSKGYALAFLRENNLYTASEEWQAVGVEYGDFDGLLAAYRAENGPLLEHEELSDLLEDSAFEEEIFESIMVQPIVMKIANNLPTLISGEVKKTSDGYILTYDLIKIVNTFLEQIGKTLDKISVKTTMSQFFELDLVKNTLNAIFRGVTAAEILALLPQEATAILPKADNKSFVEYIKVCLNSKDLYNTFFGAQNPFPGVKSFGQIKVSDILALAEVPELEFAMALGMLKQYVAELKNNLLGFLACVFTFRFDKQKNLVGIDMNENFEITVDAAYNWSEMNTIKVSAEFTAEIVDSVAMTDLSGMRYDAGGYSDLLIEGTYEYEGTATLEYYDEAEYEWCYNEFDYTMTVTIGKDNVVTVTFVCAGLGLGYTETIDLKEYIDYAYGSIFEGAEVLIYTDENGGEHEYWLPALNYSYHCYGNYGYCSFNSNYGYENSLRIDFYYEVDCQKIIKVIA